MRLRQTLIREGWVLRREVIHVNIALFAGHSDLSGLFWESRPAATDVHIDMDPRANVVPLLTV